MIANVSPSHIATEHTLNTLRYADRVKELKKGMKCCPPSARNRCTPGSLSPKRIQSSPGTQAGEKNSPKKVKLGLHHPPTPAAAARTKAPPLLCHPGHSPFSSTPKAQVRKGHPAAPLLGHPSPVKGSLRAGPPAKKPAEDPALPSEKSLFGRDLETRTAASAEARRESGQGDRQQARCLRVQPVRKQLISRGDLPFGDADRPSAQAEEGKRTFAEQCAVAWTSLPPQQKDREQHLRLYHQQFQQPPILHQKLDYQPLEKFLVRYKPQEICVIREPRCEPPLSVSPQGQDETMQLEDLEDSDFSEDSFSPGPSRRRPEAEAAVDCSQGSFFLHQRECRPEDQGGPELVFKQHRLMPQSRAFLSTEKAAGCEEAETSPAGWSTGEAAALPSFPGNEMPEKPYCSQGDRAVCNQMSTHNYLLGQKQPVFADLYLGCSDGHFFLPEKTPPSPPSAHILASARCAGSDQREELVQGKHALHPEHTGEKQQPAGEDLCEALVSSLDFVPGVATPLTVPVLGTETSAVPKEDPFCQWQGKEMLEKKNLKSMEIRNQWNEDVTQRLGSGAYETDHCRKQAAAVLSPPATATSQSCCSPKALSSLGGASSLRRGRDCGLSPGDAGLEGILFSVYEESESTLRLGDLQVDEGVTGPHHDTNTEATRIASLSCLGQFSLGEEDDTQPTTQLKPVGMPEKSLVSSAAPISDGTENHESSGESFPLQPSLEFRSLELGHAQEALKLTFNREEMGLLKNKLSQSALTHHSSDAAQQNAQIDGREITASSFKNSLPAYGQLEPSTVSLQCQETLGRQFVLQIRQEQLEEMAALCLEEESLISQISDMDFEGLVVKLDEMLMLKSKCIQRMRAQLQPLLATPNGLALQGLSPTLL